MNLTSENQIHLYTFKNRLHELIELFNKDKFPNKVIFSGPKGIGKCTLAYHLINYVLSVDEDFPYDYKNNIINPENKSFKLIQNKSCPNFNLIDINEKKKSIDISQIRNLILDLNKSSFNSKPRFILINNIEFLNINSINALLKVLEEPSVNTYFILINNNKKVLATLKSRCLDFKISLTHEESINISNKLIDTNVLDLISEEILDYYFTPGKIYNLIKFSRENSFDLKNLSLKNFLSYIIDKNLYKKDNPIKYMIYDFFELYLIKKSSAKDLDFVSYFLNQIRNLRKFNLDEDTLLLDFKYKQLNG